MMTMRRARRLHSARSQRRRMRGQAMIEYTVVLAFSVIILLQPFPDPNNPNVQQTAIEQLATAIRDYHKSYTYAMAIASIPECDYTKTFDKSSLPAGIDLSKLPAQFTSVTVSTSIDRCVDWSNPTIPIPSVSMNGLPSLGDIKDYITQTVSNSINGIKDQITNAALNLFKNPF